MLIIIFQLNSKFLILNSKFIITNWNSSQFTIWTRVICLTQRKTVCSQYCRISKHFIVSITFVSVLHFSIWKILLGALSEEQETKQADVQPFNFVTNKPTCLLFTIDFDTRNHTSYKQCTSIYTWLTYQIVLQMSNLTKDIEFPPFSFCFVKCCVLGPLKPRYQEY